MSNQQYQKIKNEDFIIFDTDHKNLNNVNINFLEDNEIKELEKKSLSSLEIYTSSDNYYKNQILNEGLISNRINNHYLKSEKDKLNLESFIKSGKSFNLSNQNLALELGGENSTYESFISEINISIAIYSSYYESSDNWRFTANEDFPFSLIDIKNESYKEITSLPLNDDNHYEISLNYPINSNFEDIENNVIDQNLSYSQVSSQQSSHLASRCACFFCQGNKNNNSVECFKI